MGLVLLLAAACNSDLPEPAEADLPSAGLRLRVTRVATHPFLSRYRLTLQVDGPQGCTDTAELFPDTGYAGRRNLYEQASGTITLVGQYDAREIDRTHCTIRLVEFQSLVGQSNFLGSYNCAITYNTSSTLKINMNVLFPFTCWIAGFEIL